jgi:tetratricopeptide (TPR) repeat protein
MTKSFLNNFSSTIILCLIITCVISPINTFSEDGPLNVRLTNAVWKAFNAKDYHRAIKRADECIDEFEPAALREQRDLEEKNTPPFPEGKVDENTKSALLKRGLLNDVATCWFIKGRSLEKVGKKQEAINAFKHAERYSYARTWDPELQGFWSPEKGAKERRLYLEGK